VYIPKKIIDGHYTFTVSGYNKTAHCHRLSSKNWPDLKLLYGVHSQYNLYIKSNKKKFLVQTKRRVVRNKAMQSLTCDILAL